MCPQIKNELSTLRLLKVINVKKSLKTYRFIGLTQCKGVICHLFKTAKIIVFDPMKKAKCALTRRAALFTNFVAIQYSYVPNLNCKY